MKTSKITALYMGEVHYPSGSWFPIQKLTWNRKDNRYVNCKIVFTEGAKELRNLYSSKTPLLLRNLTKVIKSKDIESCLWQSRLPANGNYLPDSSAIAKLGLDPGFAYDPIQYASRSGGYRKGDNKDLFPEIEPDEDGNYNFYFRGICRWNFKSRNLKLETTEVGDKVLPIIEKGEWRLKNRDLILGSMPCYIQHLYFRFKDSLKITVAIVNQGAFDEDLIVYKAVLNQTVGIPFIEKEYQPLTSSPAK
jgi:hypothetical protein